jgi:uncharacterized protein (UPF0210 family)
MRQLNFSGEEILETITMVRTEQLDIRTITIGISLLDCVSDSPETLCRNVYEKIEGVARNLRRISAEISDEFGLPIINNRIAVGLRICCGWRKRSIAPRMRSTSTSSAASPRMSRRA